MPKLLSVSILLLAVVTSAAALSTEFDVDQVGLRFTRSSLHINAGSSIRFHNSDDVIHNILTIDEQDLTEDFGLQKPGEIIRARFARPGRFQVRCSIHPKMKLNVAVSE